MERPYSTSSRTCRAFLRRRCAEAGWQRPSHAAESRKKPQVPATTLRSGRDDNLVGTRKMVPPTELSSRPERSVVEGSAVSFGSTSLGRCLRDCWTWAHHSTVHPCRFTAQPLRILEFPADALLRFVCMHCTAGDAGLFPGGNIEFPTRSKRDRQSMVRVLSHSCVVQPLDGPGSVCPAASIAHMFCPGDVRPCRVSSHDRRPAPARAKCIPGHPAP